MSLEHRNILNKKFFNKEIYSKYVIKTRHPKAETVSLDNSYSNFPITTNILRKKVVYVKGRKMKRYSFNYRTILYKKDSCKLFGFNYLALFGENPTSFVRDFSSTIRRLSEQSDTKNICSVIKCIKGGFKCYASGLFGFMPTKHYEFVKKPLKSVIHTIKKLTRIKKVSVFKIPFLKVQLKNVYFQKRKRNFFKRLKKIPNKKKGFKKKKKKIELKKKRKLKKVFLKKKNRFLRKRKRFNLKFSKFVFINFESVPKSAKIEASL